MKRFALLLALGLGVVSAAPAAPAAPPKGGTYELAIAAAATVEQVPCLVKIEEKDGRLTGEVTAQPPGAAEMTVKDVALDGDLLRFTIATPNGDWSFEGKVPQAGAATVPGSLETATRLSAATLKITDKTELKQADAMRRVTLPPAMQKVTQASMKPLLLRGRAQRTKDAEEKAKLLKEAEEAKQELRTELPKLYRDVIDQNPDTPSAVEAARGLLREAGRDKASADDARRLAQMVLTAAAAHGPRYEAEAVTQLAETLVTQDPYATLALQYAQRAEKGLTAKDSADKQDRVLSVLEVAQRKAGKTADAAATEGRLAKVRAESDREFLAKLPSLKTEPYAGRKAAGDRAVVMELFTGAECPPCVAADVAFDALEKTYKPADLILIQYHLHIPGPDPLTNPSGEARWDYYRKLFEGDVRGTPTTVFNGKPQAGGGGAIARAQTKYDEYRKIIDDLLEEPAKAAVTVAADLRGDALTVRAKVSNLAEPGEAKRLKFVVVEEKVRYAGGNRLRFHHVVVRAMPGGADGLALTQREGAHEATLQLGELRQELTKYLDDYAADQRPFPKLDRPMALKHLKVIALVQDDKTGEILQAAVTDVGGERAAR
jgi:hypothetical protein